MPDAADFRPTSRLDQMITNFGERFSERGLAADDLLRLEMAKVVVSGSRMSLSPLDLAYEIMTRSGRIDHDKLEKRDPAFVAAWAAQRPTE